ncbi:hypothetical protein AAG570_008042 [Ranatra chinensis]|uniref:Regulator of telomere elongation helicase 1 homolog n=1 Tax=Ranatra chinensis TaxID=642074 RepID=A0ABD0XTP2_9HEMI
MDEDCFISVEREYNAEDVCIFKEKLQKLEKILNDLEPNKSDIGVTYKGSYIFEILGKAEITRQNHGEIANLALKISDDIVSLNSGSLYSKRGISLRKFAESLLSLYSFIGPSADYKTTDINFKMYIEQEVVKRPSSNMWLTKSDVLPTKAKRVNFWCFNPGFGMSGLINNNVHCVILTSGTLSPLNATINELGLNNPVTLENPHIINPSQVLVNIIPNGPRNLVLNSSFNNRENDDYWTELGLTLQNFSRIIPQGVLVFFPSYTTLNKAQKSWQVSGLWKKINNSKPIFVEPPNKVHLKDVLADYRKAIDSGNGKGAILLGVCRGKISEGFDFRNDYCRGVLITGIPFPPLLDPRISLKKQYMDETYSKKGIMSGETWYNCEAMRAVNQAIGRVIRHSKDFGAILLCDVRFSNKNNLSYLSKWLCPYIKKMKTFGESIASLTSFFRDNSQVSFMIYFSVQLFNN